MGVARTVLAGGPLMCGEIEKDGSQPLQLASTRDSRALPVPVIHEADEAAPADDEVVEDAHTDEFADVTGATRRSPTRTRCRTRRSACT